MIITGWKINMGKVFVDTPLDVDFECQDTNNRAFIQCSTINIVSLSYLWITDNE